VEGRPDVVWVVRNEVSHASDKGGGCGDQEREALVGSREKELVRRCVQKCIPPSKLERTRLREPQAQGLFKQSWGRRDDVPIGFVAECFDQGASPQAPCKQTGTTLSGPVMMALFQAVESIEAPPSVAISLSRRVA
jgi:hypothetical protein